jgi:ribosomal protein S1
VLAGETVVTIDPVTAGETAPMAVGESPEARRAAQIEGWNAIIDAGTSEIRVQSVMFSARGASVASVNGKLLKVGDTLQVYVQDPENRDGELVLSVGMVQVARDWEEALQLQAENGIVQSAVIGCNKGGLLVQFNRIRGFVPASQVAQLHGRTAAEERQHALQRMVGRLKQDIA